MPELPEVETVMRGLEPHMTGCRIVSAHISGMRLRHPWPERFAARLEGARVECLRRRAKYLLWDLDTGETVLCHLGMSGRFTVWPGAGGAAPRALGEFYFHGPSEREPGPHDHLILTLEDQTRIVYTDPRRFGFFDMMAWKEVDHHPALARLGPEPLGPDFTPARLARALRGRRGPVKTALLDQTVVAGLGNIYVCEALFRAGISPRRQAGALAPSGRPGPQLERLVSAVREVLLEAIAAGGSTLRDHARVDGKAGGFQQHFSVYGREGEPCKVCGQPVRRIMQSGRSTFFCPSCQR